MKIDPHILTEAMSPDEQRALLAKLLRDRAGAVTEFPMSAGQQGLWHAYRRDPTATPFNVFLPTRIRSAINVEALRQAIEVIAGRHPSLRTTFTDAVGKLRQRVHPRLKPDFQVVDLSGIDVRNPAGREQAILQTISAVTLEPFDLEHGPLLSVRVFRVATDDWIVLAMTHHIIVDFWSLVLILNELREAYPAFASGREPQLAPPRGNYAAFGADQERLLASPRGARLQAYWSDTVRDVASVVDLPTDFVRPAVFTGRAANVPLQFPPSTAQSLFSMAARTRSTPFAIVQAALQVFIQRYSGQDNFFIGSPFSGRTQREYEETVGFFVNMLPLRADLSGQPTFEELIHRVSGQLLDALEHEAYPISRIVQDARTPRDPSRSPLFQVSCTFEKSHVKAEAGRAAFLFPGAQQVWDFGGLRQESYYVPHPTCHYDLEFIFEITQDGLRGLLCYCRDLFSAESAALMAGNFRGLLSSLLENLNLPVSQVPWNDNATVFPVRSSVVEQRTDLKPSEVCVDAERTTVDRLLVASVRDDLHQPALRFAGRQLSYGQVLRLAEEVARELAPGLLSPGLSSPGLSSTDGSPTVADEPLVPVATASGPEALIGMLAVHLAGAAAVPIDLSQAPLDVEGLLIDTAAPLLLADAKHAWLDKARDRVRIVDVSDLLNRHMGLPADDTVSSRARPHGLAYCVYTSGSTGKPKGVLVEHRAVCNTLAWRRQAVPLNATDRVLMLLSHQFDAGLGIAWTTLTQGAELIWADADARRDPQKLIEQIQRDKITVLPAVPSLLKILVTHSDFPACDSLRMIFTGGEAMPPELPSWIRAATRNFPNPVAFWNFYGPTEAAIEATAEEVTQHSAAQPVAIGRTIANTEILVLDEHLRPVPDTVPGQLAIAGAGLARGYLNDTSLTDQRFVWLEGRGTAKRRVYLTGDRGRRLPHGSIEFLGRTDHQIKLRGYRIELGEIEAVLEAHPRIARAAVRLVGSGESARLLGYFSLRDDKTPVDKIELRRFAGDQLAAHKLPSVLIQVDPMPLTASGKVDRKRLPEVTAAAGDEMPLVLPATELEEFLSLGWAEALGLEREQVGTNVNFFDAGGSSLAAAMLTNRWSQELKVHVPTALLFDLADIAQVATRLVQLYPDPMCARFGQDCLDRQLALAAKYHASKIGVGVDRDGTHDPTLTSHPLIAHFDAMDSSRVESSPTAMTAAQPLLFMIHPPGGIVVCYRELARRLTGSARLLAIRARGLHGHEPLPPSIEAMATDYVEALHSVQPAGPYILGGWSLGGLIAYEMAQQIIRGGQSLAQLILLDTTIPEGATSRVPAAELVNVGLEYGIELTLDQLGELAPEEQLPFLWEHAKQLGVLDDDSAPEVVAGVLNDLQHLFHHHVALARAYQMQPLAGHVELFRPTEVPFELQVSEDRGWGYLAQSVNVHFVPGHHHSMVQPPHVEQLAAGLVACLHSVSK